MAISSLKNIGSAFVVSLMLSGVAHAAVTVNIPEEIDLHVVNMEKPEIQGSIFDANRSVELPDGLNQIAFRYSQNFVKRDKAKKVYSELIIFKFEASDKKLTFRVPDYRNAREAEEGINDFNWALVDIETNQAIKTVSDKISPKGFVLGQNFSDEVESYNKKGGKAAVGLTYVTIANPAANMAAAPQAASARPAAAISTQIVDTQPAPQGSVLGGLQRLYLQASKEERKAFRKWMIDQE
ncbi:DUF2057 family protein [Vibrio ostreae]|uniref:UPF0319 protein KNV97_12765 n=1 Tax=Vibrio ostreae TaxID=2841925 RepID=A0A975YPZ3_9VIBR|nr:DUF2057 family protein [Vibrio ostreae]QXO19066.1 DUF2057 family protein [Vibrio ostreae]